MIDEPTGMLALPGLLRLLNDPERRSGAAESLLAIGPSGLLSLTNALHNPDARVRLAIVTAIEHSVNCGKPKYADPKIGGHAGSGVYPGMPKLPAQGF